MSRTTDGYDTRWIRERRPPKESVDPREPLGQMWEEERIRRATRAPCLTVFLAGAECPFTCLFCDLWRRTLDGPTPPGALPAQLERALEAAGSPPTGAADRTGTRAGPAPAAHLTVKLYNASNFFDPGAVPPEDHDRLCELVAGFDRVVVECHPRLVDSRCRSFADGLDGQLQVAMGLETVHPEAFPRLNLGMELEDYDRAAAELQAAGLEIRAFVLLGTPFVPEAERVESTVRAVRYAEDRGADHVSIVPVRTGNGALEVVREKGAFRPPTLRELEAALERCLGTGDAVVTADLWDAERLAGCRRCASRRLERLRSMNLTGEPGSPVTCRDCGAG